jgi:hypothetical protein
MAGVTVAAGLYGTVLVLSFAAELDSVPGFGAVIEPGGVLAGILFAGWWAFRNSGLAVSVSLVLGPVLGRLTYYSWVYAGRRAMPVALPLSFGGHGAWELWVPLAVLLGLLAFGAGVVLRRGTRVVGSGR